MIVIEVKQDRIKINGHSNFNNKGYDIICAAISAIAQSAINWFKPEDISLNISDGFFELIIINKDIKNFEKLNLLKIQLQTIYEKYKKNIKLIINL